MPEHGLHLLRGEALLDEQRGRRVSQRVQAVLRGFPACRDAGRLLRLAERVAMNVMQRLDLAGIVGKDQPSIALRTQASRHSFKVLTTIGTSGTSRALVALLGEPMVFPPVGTLADP